MSKFLIDTTPVRLTFPDGEWVDLKKERSQADSDYIMSKMVKISGDRAEISLALGKLPTMERAIVGWSFDVPVKPENVSNLQEKYRTLILAKIDELAKATPGFLPPKEST